METKGIKGWLLVLLIGVLQLTGCATYRQQVADGLNLMEQGQYQQAIKEMSSQYSDRSDQLLKEMELGLLNYLDGQYQQAIEHLDLAERIADELYTKRLSDMLLVAMSSPRQGPYRGTQLEKVFIHYYKSLAYLQLAQHDGKDYQSYLDKARVETRRVDILLSEIAFTKGDYEQAKEKREQTFGKILRLFSQLNSGRDAQDELEYREDAYIRYLNGIIYEINSEYDDARIAYQKAATLYEQGFAKQHGIPHAMTQEAWLSTLRMMKRAGGYGSELSRLSNEKLDDEGRKALDAYDAESAQLIVIQHLGVIPHRGEMNLHARVNPINKELVVNVVATGDRHQQQDQVAWFQALYAERGILDYLVNFHNGGVIGTIEGVFTKKITLSPMWDVVTKMGIDEAWGGIGIRLAVPYYPSKKVAYRSSSLMVDGKAQGELVMSQSLAAMAVNEQILHASSDFNEALAREGVKNLMAYQLGNGVGSEFGLGGLMGSLSKLATAATVQAESRNWLTLPSEIRLKRVFLPAGEHQVTLLTSGESGPYAKQDFKVNLAAGGSHLLMPRTINHRLEQQQPTFYRIDN